MTLLLACADPSSRPVANPFPETVDAPVDSACLDPRVWYFDGDEDGYGDPDRSQTECEREAGYIAGGVTAGMTAG